MSYEIKGFDPLNPKEDTFTMVHFEQNDIGVHVVDPEALVRKTLHERVVLADMSMPVAGHSVGMAAEMRPGKNYLGQDARLFDAAVDVLPGHLNGARLLTDMHETYEDFASTWQDKAYPAHLFYRVSYMPGRVDDDAPQPDKYLDFAVATDESASRVQLGNQMQFGMGGKPGRNGVEDSRETARPSQDHDEFDEDDESVHFGRPLHKRLLMAPANSIIGEGRNAERQMQFYLRGAISVVSAVHKHGLRGRSQAFREDIIVTPDGPLYFNPDSGDFVHSLKRAVTVLREKPAGREAASGRSYKKPESFEQPNPEDTFQTMYGIDSVKKPLLKVANFFRHPEKVERWRAKRPAGVLLYGPAGTGKTSLVHALANEIGADIREVKGDQIYHKYIGEAERRLAAIFKEAREAKTPVVFFFDEIEGLVSTTQSTDGASGTVNAVAGMFKKETSAIAKANPNVMFAAATNYIDRVDPTLIRAGRFDIQLQVGEPNEAARQAIFGGVISEKAGIDLANDVLSGINGQLNEQLISVETAAQVFHAEVISEKNLAQLASLTEGKTGADIRNIVDEVLSDKLDLDIAGHVVGPVTAQDLIRKIREMSSR
jgi:DNA polymerase III delta prime subunit